MRDYSPRIKSCCSKLPHSHTRTLYCTVHTSGDPPWTCLCVCVCLHGGVCHCSATHSLNLSGLDIMCVSHISAGRWGTAKNRRALTWINSTACSLSLHSFQKANYFSLSQPWASSSSLCPGLKVCLDLTSSVIEWWKKGAERGEGLWGTHTDCLSYGEQIVIRRRVFPWLFSVFINTSYIQQDVETKTNPRPNSKAIRLFWHKALWATVNV